MSFSVTILGSSAALPAYGRNPSAQYVAIQNQHFLIDCGEGTQMQLVKFQVPAHRINHIFISHLHGDHYLGIMGLLFSMHLQKRTADLHVYSPAGLDEIILLHLKHSRSVLNYEIKFHVFDPLQRITIFEDAALAVETIPLRHKLPCAGFLFREKQKPFKLNKEKITPSMKLQHLALLKTGADIYDTDHTLLYRNEEFTLPPLPSYSYAYCSDTAWNNTMIDQLTGVDLLYHEATFMEADGDKALETQHSTTTEAARMALQCKAGKLIIGHFSARYKDLQLVVEEARKTFRNTELAIEGITFELPA
ncbi:MAG: ribonuclease Z [Cytophagales bacterium]|nr:ribonuclease Z [Cytophagales bacterium]